jgi:tRNA (cytidine/uridine-2'-O-)-methyltransferase
MSAFYPQTLFKVILIEPEIPNNTGNIGRTCVGTWSQLQLVGPLGFSIDDKSVKRAGLDYWQNLDLIYHKNCEAWLKSLKSTDRIHVIETGSDKTIYDIDFKIGDSLVFGRETTGVPRHILDKYSDQVYSIPFPGNIRSFNLSNCVAMVMGEALRQTKPTSEAVHKSRS